MDDTKYLDQMASKFYTMMKGEVLEAGLRSNRSADRVGVFQELLLEAVRESTLSCFNGRPHYFNGKIYVPLGGDSWDAFNSLIHRIADKCGLPAGDKIKLEGVKRVCRGEVSLKTFEPDNSIIVLNNGVLDLETNVLHKFNKRFKQVTQMDFDYMPDEVPYIWTEIFLNSVLDEASQRVLQEFMGAIFIDRRNVKIEKMMILYGAGSNGKSVIQSTLIGLLGEDNVKTIPVSELMSGSERKQNVASVNGKRLNYCSEIQTREFGVDADRLKALISGEPVEVRLVYVNNFTARNIPLIMANANRIPYFKDVSHGLARKLIIIPFERVIEEQNQNKQLAKELRKEYPAILNWMLAGRRRLIANGYQFAVPDKSQDLVAECQAEGSSVLQFMRYKDFQRNVLDVDREIRWVESQKLYQSYVAWCLGRDIKPETIKRFGLTLTEAGYAKKRSNEGQLYGIYQSRTERKIKEEWKRADENDLVEGMDNLAHWIGVNKQLIERMMRNNLLEGCYIKEESNKSYKFKLRESRVAVKKYLKKVRKDYDKDFNVTPELAQERKDFNKSMRDRGLPYRKAERPENIAEGIIYVTDDFNYDLDGDNYKMFVKFKNFKPQKIKANE